jgi:serine/threonine-protein kinase
VSIALKHVSEEPLPMHQLRPDVNPRLEQAVGRALLKDPAQRFASADEFIAALEQAGAAIASGDNGGGTSTFVPLAPPPEERDPRGPRWPWILAALLALAAVAFVALAQPFSASRVTVPKVVGKRATLARATLEKAGLKVKTHGVLSSVKPGFVVTQDPKARTTVDKGSAVDLGVSRGPGMQLVPDVANLPAKVAVQALNTAGFKVTQDTQPSLTVAKGSAIKTSPPANQSIPKGSDVRLLVSSGPPQVAVPPVVGETRSVAQAAIQGAGLKVGTQTATSNSPKDQVIAQNPAGNSTVDKGSLVTITVSKGPEKVDVPDVVGQLRADAIATLRGAGFKVTVVKKESTQPKDTVFRQSPASPSKAVKGSTVTIYVAMPPKCTPGTGPGTGTGTTTTPSPNPCVP